MPTEPTKNSLVPAALVLALGLVVSTGIAAKTAYKVKSIGNTISVTGSAEKLITSDQVKWSGRFTRVVAVDGLKDGSVAIRKDLDAAMALLKAAGVKETQITVRPLSTYPLYSNDQYNGGASRITGYNNDQTFTVESDDVAGVTKLAQDAPSALLGGGAVFTTDTLEYFYSQFAALKVDMLADATSNAKLRAEKIAESTGTRLGALQSAAMGVFQVTAPNSVDVSDYGQFDTSTIEKKVTAVVRGAFTLR